MRRRACFIGRFQPFHRGHEWLIDQALDKDRPVLILVMEMPIDNNNPIHYLEIVHSLRKYYRAFDVEVRSTPPIDSINYGRKVGYDIIEHIPPPEIAKISATEIRSKGAEE